MLSEYLPEVLMLMNGFSATFGVVSTVTTAWLQNSAFIPQ
jgi:hypothetical protein